MELKDRIAAILNYVGLSASAFAKRIGAKTSQAIYDLLSGKTKTLSSDIINKIVSCYPSLSIEWLMTGEGEMIKPSVQQTSFGDHSPNVNGDDNHFESSGYMSRAFEEISEQRKLLERALSLLEKRDNQIDRLISLLEFQTKN